jgi:3-methyladenine DNA glycosylase/8-oxoguanine DNA glycosylase
MKIALAADGPLDAAATLARYHLWGEDPANRLHGDAFWRVARVDGRLLPYEVRWSGGVDDARLDVTVPDAAGVAIERAVTSEVRRIFGLDFDLTGFYRMAKGDRALAPLVERLYGLRPTLAPTPLEMLVGSITAQQVNLSFAFACRGRRCVAGAPPSASPAARCTRFRRRQPSRARGSASFAR